MDLFPPSPATGFVQPRTRQELWELLSSPQATLHDARHLGEALVKSGTVSVDQVRRALLEQVEERQRGGGSQLGQMLIRKGVINEAQLMQVIAGWLGHQVVDPQRLELDPQALALLPRAVAEREGVLPLLVRGDLLVLLMADPQDRRLLDELRFMTQHRIQAVQAAPGTLLPAIARGYERPVAVAEPEPGKRAGPVHAAAKDLALDLSTSSDLMGHEAETDVVSESDNTLVRLINSLIEEAIAKKASDIHIETQPAPRKVRIRLRLDGELMPYLEVSARYRFALVARIKIMAGMDISEHRKPQDGKIDFSRFGGIKSELRVVTVPTNNGLEDVVLRLLAGSRPMPIDSIGLSKANLRDLRVVTQKPYGLILVCGPTGSGKTTTLHSLISDINTDSRKIWTAEDPIEITQEGLRQVQVNSRIGWTFAAAMRTFLRADPDVIMIGEMRDQETAGIAIEASLTGHLVLSTLHTNSAPESISRLLEIGLDPFNFSDSLLAILAQRLVRRLCRQCVQSRPATAEEIQVLASHYIDSVSQSDERDQAALIARWTDEHGVPDGHGTQVLHTYTRQGCPACDGHGYKGRLGLYELMLNSDEVRQHIRRRASAGDIRLSAVRSGMKTLRQDGIEKVLAGLTDLSEVIAASNL